jgi:hypothetical protein
MAHRHSADKMPTGASAKSVPALTTVQSASQKKKQKKQLKASQIERAGTRDSDAAAEDDLELEEESAHTSASTREA